MAVTVIVAEAEARLHAAGRAWASARGAVWDELCNGGPWPADRPDLRYPFRYAVLRQVAEWMAGTRRQPPADLEALPAGMQDFLALDDILRPAAGPDPEAAARHLREAEALAAGWVGLLPSPRRGSTDCPAAPDGRGAAGRGAWRAPESAASGHAGETAAELLANVVARGARRPALSGAAAAARALLAEGPRTQAEFGALVRSHGRLPASVMEEIGAWCKDGRVGLGGDADG